MAFSGGKRGGTGPTNKVWKRNSVRAVGKITLPSEGGKHMFKKLALCRMEIQQNLKAVWKNLENIMTMDVEMKDLSAKAAKPCPKEENCKNNTQFPFVFAIKPCLDGGSKSGKQCQDAFNNAYE